MITHPNFNDNTFQHDIAVIKVEGEMKCKQRVVYPACLPNANKLTYEGWPATTVSGWGRLSEDGDRPDYLQKAKIPVVSDQKCKDKMSKQPGSPGIQVCYLQYILNCWHV